MSANGLMRHPTNSLVTEMTSAIPPCDKPDGLGLFRIVQIDSTGGPEFGAQPLKGHDFLRDKEVVLTFDDGPWPGSTEAVLKALTDDCLKATFFEIGEHASWHPQITKQVIDAGMTVGTHTWSHEDLARIPYVKDREKAEWEIEMGNAKSRHQRMSLGKSTVGPTVRNAPIVAMPIIVPMAKSVPVTRWLPRPYRIKDRR